MNDALSTGHCAGHPDPDMWFRQNTWRIAKAACGTCPARNTCLDQALEFELKDYLARLAEADGRGTSLHCEGVWGAKTGPERKRIIEQRMRTTEAVAA